MVLGWPGGPVPRVPFGSKSVRSPRPLLLGPPLRPDPQSYSALSDYLLPTPTLLCGIVSAIVLMLFPRRFRAPSLNDAVSFLFSKKKNGGWKHVWRAPFRDGGVTRPTRGEAARFLFRTTFFASQKYTWMTQRRSRHRISSAHSNLRASSRVVLRSAWSGPSFRNCIARSQRKSPSQCPQSSGRLRRAGLQRRRRLQQSRQRPPAIKSGAGRLGRSSRALAGIFSTGAVEAVAGTKHATRPTRPT